MRGGDVRTGELFSYVDLEDRVRRDHPLRAVRLIVNDALALLEGEYATSTPHRFLGCSVLRLIYGPSNELTEEYLTSSL